MFDHKYKACDGDVLDLTSFNIEIPKPDARVDINLALKEYNLDLENITFIYRNDAEQSLETNWRVLLNHRDWTCSGPSAIRLQGSEPERRESCTCLTGPFAELQRKQELV